MDTVTPLHKENFDISGNRIKGKEVAKGSTVGNLSRKGLADISNLPQPKGSTVGNLPRKGLSDISNLPQPNDDLRPQPQSTNTEEYIRKLHQENVSLHELLAERTKIIQLQVIELQKFRTAWQQVQQKNLHLVQTNSLMLAELNSAKDKLKVLEHELGCEKGLRTARKLESEAEPTKCCEAGKFPQTGNKNNGPRNKKRMRQSKSLQTNSVKPVQVQEKIDERRRCSRRQSTRFKVGEEEPTTTVDRSDTLDPTRVKLVPAEHLTDEETKYENKVDAKRCRLTRQSARLKVEEEPTAKAEIHDTPNPATNEVVQTEMKIDDNRLCSRRQSARFRHQEEVQEPTGDSPQIDNVKVPVSPLHECDPASSVEIKFESAECISQSEDSNLKRTSIRPKRQAAEKVQSYKEIPVNVKMRRMQ
ncbi:Shugoshin C terminus [Euphorbia peplus]|nr:Shugoshin C terminus [Euphorbia peplus]